MGVTRIESNQNRHFGLKIESKSIENRNLEIVTSLVISGVDRTHAPTSHVVHMIHATHVPMHVGHGIGGHRAITSTVTDGENGLHSEWIESRTSPEKFISHPRTKFPGN